VAAAGGTVTVIAEGAPFNEPAGIAVTAAGDIYVIDTSGSASGLGNIIVVTGNTATEYIPNLQFGYPAGLALLADDSMLLGSGMDNAAQSNILYQVTVATKAVNNNTSVVGAFAEAAGLHRAHNTNVFAWADTKATPSGMTGTGTVFVIK
jgi:DNA-binding beta-propeller fold protein YncE